MKKMTVAEYREKHQNCEYCKHAAYGGLCFCPATRKPFGWWSARRCPCYTPAKYHGEEDTK